MELKLNLGILCLLGAVWASLTITEETAALEAPYVPHAIVGHA